MEDTKMRKTMMLATALLAACGSIAAPKGDDTGSGSDVGSGSGVMDTSCTTAADCGAGMACATDTHECVAAAFTLDKAGFYDDGTRWWTSSDAPTLHGTIDDAGGQSLDAYIGGTKVGTATIDGTTWSIPLPAGSIKATDTAITMKLGTLEQRQTFALDNAAPAITLFGSVKDERGDAIDFTTGEPVHTHSGAAIDLTGTGCPAVYKYAYLMDATKPMYGREVTPNAFTWQIKASDATPLDSMDSAYRVRDDAGRVLYDWTSISPDATGVYNVALYRNAIPALGTYAGKIYMDVRFRDAFGNEATREACFDNHPMAAPIEVQPLATGELFGWTLPADSPISRLLNTTGTAVISQGFVQHTAEPITIHVSIPAPAVHFTMTGVDHMVAGTTTAVSLSCADATSGACAPVTDPPGKVASGTLNETWIISVFDETAGHATTCAGLGLTVSCTLAARTASEAPHRYRVDMRLADVHELWPYEDLGTSAGNFGEFSFDGLIYTGLAPRSAPAACSHVATHVVNGQVGYTCTQQTQYTEVRALQKATLAVPQITETLKTSASASAAGEVPSYLSGGLMLGAVTWNAGTDVLPQ
jgi:hypothetical protein